MIRGRRVHVQPLELAANPSIHIEDVKRRRFRLIDSVCPVCEARVQDLLEHCRTVGDDMHGMLEVMVS